MLRLEETYAEIRTISSSEKAGRRIYNEINAQMKELRTYIDRYEVIASKEFYHIPTYEEMLFSLTA